MSRTQIIREYLLGATSQGHAYPLDATTGPLTAKPIVQVLDENHITWKDYVHPLLGPTPCTTASCLMGQSYLAQFSYAPTIVHNEPDSFAPSDSLPWCRSEEHT